MTLDKHTSPLEDVHSTTLPGYSDIIRNGWRFDGWSLAPGAPVSYAPGATITAPLENLNLYAHWTARLYTVAYETGDGTYIRTRTDVTWDSTDVVPMPATRVGYVFLGWHTSSVLDEDNWRTDQLARGTSFAAIAAILGATDTITRVTLYAWFTPERAELHYAVGSGSGSVSNDFEVVNAGDGKPSGSIATAAPGYVFEGWYDARGNLAPHGRNPIFAPTKGADDVWFTGTTWYARFAPITYTITFDGNGADPSSPGMQDMTAAYEVPTALTMVGVKFTKEAYVFDGWNTEADGSGTRYMDGETIVNLATVQDEVIRLFAQWRVVGYTITYDRNNDVRGLGHLAAQWRAACRGRGLHARHRCRHGRDVAPGLHLRWLV